MTKTPLTVHVLSRERDSGREIRRQYVVETDHPRWELVKIMFHVLFNIRF